MPLFSIHSNQKPLQADSLTRLSAAVAALLGKSEQYVMLEYQHLEQMLFAGSHEPCAMLHLKSLGLSSEQTNELSPQICQLIELHFGIDGSRVYIQFEAPERAYWGWNSRTFA